MAETSTDTETERGLAVQVARLDERMEAMHAEMRASFQSVDTHFTRLNGQVASNTTWRNEHTQTHAVAVGQQEARAALRKGDWALLAGLLGGAGAVSAIVDRVLA